MSRTALVDRVTGTDIDFGDVNTNLAYIRQYLSEQYPPVVQSVTTSDTATLSNVLWLRVGTAGSMKVKDSHGHTTTLVGLQAGETVLGRFTMVYATDTTCTGIVAFCGYEA
jgi:hypothetical protein